MKSKEIFPTESLWSKWTIWKGRWDNKANKYVDCTKECKEHSIYMHIILRGEEPILEFLGGPVGNKAYYIKDLLDAEYGLEKDPFPVFAINTGTINSWPRCEVDSACVLAYLKSFEKAWQKST